MTKKMSEVLYEKVGRRAVITLNRPERFNAISDTLPILLEQAVLRAEADTDVRVIFLKGAGKAFCSGYDLKVFAETPGVNAGWQDSTTGFFFFFLSLSV